MTLSVSAAQHEAERESWLCDKEKQIWITRAGLAEGGHPAGLRVSVWGHSGPPATCLRPAGLLHPSDRPEVGALLHHYHGGGAVRTEGWTGTLRSASWRLSQVNTH